LKKETGMKAAKFDAAEYIEDEGDVLAFLEAALEENDPQYFIKALGIVARSKGMTEIAKKTGRGRESLYKAFSATGNPGFVTVFQALDALWFNLRVEPKAGALV
jgi:probable addiction module antidote protein